MRRRRVRRGAGGAWSLYRSLRRTGTINPEQHGIGSAIDIWLCYEQGKGREGKVPRRGSHLSAVEGRAPDVGQRRGKMGARWRAWLLGCANGPGRRPGGKRKEPGGIRLVGPCGGINPYTLTARLQPGSLAHYETSSRLDPTARVSCKETRCGDQAGF